MARNVTLAQLRTDARFYSDTRSNTPGSGLITDAELNRLINLRLAELHEILLGDSGSEYANAVADSTIALVAGTSAYDLPADFFRLLSVHIVWGPEEIEELRLISSQVESVRFRSSDWGKFTSKGFRLKNAQIEIFPTPTSAPSVVLRYAKAYQDLALDVDTYDGVNGWEKYVTLGAALDVLAFLRRSEPAVQALYQEQRDRLETYARERQAQDPIQIRDTENLFQFRGHPWLV